MRRKHLGWLGALTLSAALFTGFAAAPNVSPAEAAASGCRTDNHGLALKTVADTGEAHFQTIQFLSSNIGRAAGNGFMIGTSDAGCSWQIINSQGKYNFTQMDFLTNSVGYVMAQTKAGGPSLVFRTTDGGTSYTQVHTGAYAFDRIQFLTDKIGYGFTRALTFKTADGGQTWKKVSTPPNTRYVHFITQDKAWAIIVKAVGGYEVKRTVNGGASWTTMLTVKSGEAIGGAIYGTDSSDVYVVLLGGSGMSQTSYSLYHTRDAGAHWKQLISNSTAGGGPAPGPEVKGLEGPPGSPENMQVIGREAAYLAASSGAYEKVSISRSLDDGATMTPVTPVEGYAGRLSFTSAKSGWLAVTSISNSAVYATADGGKTWSKKFAIPSTENQ